VLQNGTSMQEPPLAAGTGARLGTLADVLEQDARIVFAYLFGSAPRLHADRPRRRRRDSPIAARRLAVFARVAAAWAPADDSRPAARGPAD
jgi:hypothetical protein